MIESHQTDIRTGSKSFFLASLFFDQTTKQACWNLYQWCRYCDDQVDMTQNIEESKVASDELFAQWRRDHNISREFALARRLKEDYSIPEQYFLDLLLGFKMDCEQSRFKSIQEVEKYAYHVAGVVGLKMSYIMGISNPKALKHAIDLGIGMQLTNIARDVKEDWLRGRIYLPGEWLTEKNIDSQDIMLAKNKQSLYQVVIRLLDHADQYYKSGFAGLQYLPLRSALAVAIAGTIYSRIGTKIRRRGITALEERTIVSLPEKLWCTCLGILKLAPLAWRRCFQPWTKTDLLTTKEIV